jgi:DNA-binding transcriptional ArsR family regulator
MSRTKNVAGLKQDGDSESIELFSTAYGIRAVDSPVRVKIIAMLKEREMPFDEIVEGTGRAKSTVSVHLNDMIQEGIINSRLDSNDRRKKIFFINSSYLGGLQKDRILEDDTRDIMSRQGMQEAIDFYKIMFRTIRVEMYQEGINIDPVLSEAGYRVGGALYAYVGSPDLEELLSNLASFWEGHGLGRIVIKSRSPLTIFVSTASSALSCRCWAAPPAPSTSACCAVFSSPTTAKSGRSTRPSATRWATITAVLSLRTATADRVIIAGNTFVCTPNTQCP